MSKNRTSAVTKNTKTHRSAVTEKFKKLADPWLRKNAKNSKVRCQGNMSKTRTTAVTEICNKLPALPSQRNEKNAKVSILAKMPKSCWSRKNAKNSQVCASQKMSKTHRSAFIEKLHNLGSSRLQKYSNKFPGLHSHKIQ